MFKFVFLCLSVCVSLDHFDFVLLIRFGLFFSVFSRDTDWKERLRDDLFCVEWDVKPCSVHLHRNHQYGTSSLFRDVA